MYFVKNKFVYCPAGGQNCGQAGCVFFSKKTVKIIFKKKRIANFFKRSQSALLYSPSRYTGNNILFKGSLIAVDSLPFQPESPPVILRFRATVRPEAGKPRVFYGRANDPQRQWARDMVHGAMTNPSGKAGELLNPHPKTRFQQAIQDKKDSMYASNQRAPLGRYPSQKDGLPNHLDPLHFTFGVATELGKCF